MAGRTAINQYKLNLTGAQAEYEAVNSLGNSFINNQGKTFLHVKNASGSSTTVTIYSNEFKNERSYKNLVSSTGPILYLPLDDLAYPPLYAEDTMLCPDKRLNGTYTATDLDYRAGPDGNPVPYFDGSTSYGEFDSPDDYLLHVLSQITDEISVMAWVYGESGIMSTSSGNNMTILRISDAGLENQIQIKRTTTNGQMQFYFEGGNTADWHNVSTFSDETWHCLIVTLNTATDFYGYIDGVQNTSAAAPGDWAAADLSSILCAVGASTTVPATVWDGSAAHIAIWNRELTENEAKTLSDPGLVVTNVTVAVPAGEERFIGPFNSSVYGKRVYVSYSYTTSVSAAVFSLP